MDNMDNMDIEEDEEISENNYREETIMIRKLDCKNVKCKQFLTRSFRKLNKLVNKKRNYTLTKQNNIIDSIIEYAQIIKPYSQVQMFERGQITSKSYFDQYVAHRRCYRAKIIIDGEVIIEDNINEFHHFSAQQQKSIFKNGSFNLTLQSQPNTNIIYTINGEHPLLTQPKNRYQVSTNRQTRTLQPPQHLNVIVCGINRIQSHLSTVIIKENKNGEQSTSSQGIQNWGIVRPNNVYILDESRQMSESFKNIDNSSFLQ